MKEWSASELDRYNKRDTTRKQDRGVKETNKKRISVPRTASMLIQAAMRLKDRAKSGKASGLQVELSLDRSCASTATPTRAGRPKGVL